MGPKIAGSGRAPVKPRKLPSKAGQGDEAVQPRRKTVSSASTPAQTKRKLAKSLRPPFAVDIPTSPVLANFLSPLDVVGGSKEHTAPVALRSALSSPKHLPSQQEGQNVTHTVEEDRQAAATQLAKQQRKAALIQQILQEQQALLLEDSPVYLASLSQDNEDSLLNKAADTHDQDLARGKLRAWLPRSDPEAANMYSSKGRDAALAGLAVKVVQLEALLSSQQAQLQEMGATEQTWLEDAQRLRQAVANTLGALDAADAEGQCLKAEVEILRSTAKQNAAMLAKLEHQSLTALSPGAAANSPQPSSLCSSVVATRESQAKRMELAAIEEGLSALDHQITEAALRLTGSHSAVLWDPAEEQDCLSIHSPSGARQENCTEQPLADDAHRSSAQQQPTDNLQIIQGPARHAQQQAWSSTQPAVLGVQSIHDMQRSGEEAAAVGDGGCDDACTRQADSAQQIRRQGLSLQRTHSAQQQHAQQQQEQQQQQSAWLVSDQQQRQVCQQQQQTAVPPPSEAWPSDHARQKLSMQQATLLPQQQSSDAYHDPAAMQQPEHEKIYSRAGSLEGQSSVDQAEVAPHCTQRASPTRLHAQQPPSPGARMRQQRPVTARAEAKRTQDAGPDASAFLATISLKASFTRPRQQACSQHSNEAHAKAYDTATDLSAEGRFRQQHVQQKQSVAHGVAGSSTAMHAKPVETSQECQANQFNLRDASHDLVRAQRARQQPATQVPAAGQHTGSQNSPAEIVWEQPASTSKQAPEAGQTQTDGYSPHHDATRMLDASALHGSATDRVQHSIGAAHSPGLGSVTRPQSAYSPVSSEGLKASQSKIWGCDSSPAASQGSCTSTGHAKSGKVHLPSSHSRQTAVDHSASAEYAGHAVHAGVMQPVEGMPSISGCNHAVHADGTTNAQSPHYNSSGSNSSHARPSGRLHTTQQTADSQAQRLSTGSTEFTQHRNSTGTIESTQYRNSAGALQQMQAEAVAADTELPGKNSGGTLLSQDGLEQDNCRLRHALGAIEQQLSMLKQAFEKQQVQPGVHAGSHLYSQLQAEQQMVQQLQSEVSTVQTDAAAKDAEIAAATQKLYELTQQLAAHEHAADSAVAAKEAELASLSQQLAVNTELAQQLQLVIRDSGNSTAAKDVQIAQLTEQLSAARLEWSTLHAARSAEADAMQHKLQGQQILMQQLQSEAHNSSNSLAEKDKQIEQLTAQVSALTQDYAAHDALGTQLTNIELRNQELQILLRDSVGSSTGKDVQILHLAEQLSTARQDWSALQAARNSEVSQLQCQLVAEQTKVLKLQEAAEQHSSAMAADESAQVQAQQQAVAELTSQLEQLRQQLAQSDELRQQDTRQLHDEQQRCVAYEAAAQVTSAQLEAAQKELSQLQDSTAEQQLQLTQQLADQTEQANALTLELQQQRKVIQDLRQEVSASQCCEHDAQTRMHLLAQSEKMIQQHTTQLKQQVVALQQQVKDAEGEVQVLLGQLAVQSKLAIASSKELTHLHELVRKQENQHRLDEEQLRLAAQKTAAAQQRLAQAEAEAASGRTEAEARLQDLQSDVLLVRQQMQLHQAAAEQESSNARSWQASSEQLQWQVSDLQRKLTDAEQRSTIWARRAGAAEARLPIHAITANPRLKLPEQRVGLYGSPPASPRGVPSTAARPHGTISGRFGVPEGLAGTAPGLSGSAEGLHRTALGHLNTTSGLQGPAAQGDGLRGSTAGLTGSVHIARQMSGDALGLYEIAPPQAVVRQGSSTDCSGSHHQHTVSELVAGSGAEQEHEEGCAFALLQEALSRPDGASDMVETRQSGMLDAGQDPETRSALGFDVGDAAMTQLGKSDATAYAVNTPDLKTGQLAAVHALPNGGSKSLRVTVCDDHLQGMSGGLPDSPLKQRIAEYNSMILQQCNSPRISALSLPKTSSIGW